MTIELLRRATFNWQDRLIGLLMIGFSGMLHLVLLVTPLPPEKLPEPEPKDEETEEIIPIKSLMLSAPPSPLTAKAPPPPKSQTLPTPQAQPIPPLTPPPAAVPPPPQLPPSPGAASPNVAETPPATETQPTEAPAAQPTQTPPAPSPTAPSTTPPAAPVGGVQGAGGVSPEQVQQFVNALKRRFLESFVGSSEGEIAQIQADFDTLPFDDLAVDATPFRNGDALKAEALGAMFIPRINSGEAEDKVREVLGGAGFNEIEEAGRFGGSQLLKAKNAQGAEMYVSLVRRKVGGGVLIVLWPVDPNTLP